MEMIEQARLRRARVSAQSHQSLCKLLLAYQGFFSPFWEHDPTPRIGDFSCHFLQNWEKLTPYNIIEYLVY